MRKLVMLTMMLGTLWLVGCTGEEADESRIYDAAVAAGEEPAADLFHVDVTLHRRYTGSKWMLDKDHVFTVKDESRIRAELEFRNVRPERTYSVHLVWIKPDGDEVFRRYAEVRRHLVSLPLGVQPDSTGALPPAVVKALAAQWGDEEGARLATRLAADPEASVPVTVRTYKDAEDLGYERGKTYLDADPSFELTSTLVISRERERPLGDYLLRIYLDRRLLKEVPFTVQENT